MEAVLEQVEKALSRTERQAQTREHLRQSAERAVASVGAGAMSVEDITEAAGYSRGAFYANYRSKEDLFLEVMVNRLEVEATQWRDLADKSPDVESMLAGLAQMFERAHTGFHWSRLAMELQLHALRDDAFGTAYRESLNRHHDDVAHLFETIFTKARRVPPAEPRALAAASMAVGHGLSLQAAQAVRHGDEDCAADMFLLYLRGLIATAEALPSTLN